MAALSVLAMVAGCVASLPQRIATQAAADHGCTVGQISIRETLPSGRVVVHACDGAFYTYAELRDGTISQVMGAMPEVARGCATLSGDTATACLSAASSYSCASTEPFSHADEIARGTMWLSVCGMLRLFTLGDGAWREDHHAARVEPARAEPAYEGGGGYTGASDGRVQVRGYTRRDGTYVRPHTRSRPH